MDRDDATRYYRLQDAVASTPVGVSAEVHRKGRQAVTDLTLQGAGTYQALWKGLTDWFTVDSALEEGMPDREPGSVTQLSRRRRARQGQVTLGGSPGEEGSSSASGTPRETTQGAVLQVDPQGRVVTPQGYRGTVEDAQPAIPLPGLPEGRAQNPCWFLFYGAWGCVRGEDCPYSHSDAEVVQRQAPQRI